MEGGASHAWFPPPPPTPPFSSPRSLAIYLYFFPFCATPKQAIKPSTAYHACPFASLSCCPLIPRRGTRSASHTGLPRMQVPTLIDGRSFTRQSGSSGWVQMDVWLGPPQKRRSHIHVWRIPCYLPCPVHKPVYTGPLYKDVWATHPQSLSLSFGPSISPPPFHTGLSSSHFHSLKASFLFFILLYFFLLTPTPGAYHSFFWTKDIVIVRTEIL